MNLNLLRGLRATHNDKQIDLAKMLDLSEASYLKREKGRLPFNADEIQKIAERYNLTCKEVCDIFFNLKVDC